ncbi:MAG TPA: hypothetical protein VFD22_10350 [Gemmatimonadaceae bacterium]|nr:hypothetical protein [Gemmatimonadaceae bacterium]
MSDPHSGDSEQQAARHFLHGRHLRPLLTPLISCLIVALLIYLFEREMPAFHEVVKIGYFIIAVIFVIATGRAIRTREGRRRKGERRQGDRRHSGRT